MSVVSPLDPQPTAAPSFRRWWRSLAFIIPFTIGAFGLLVMFESTAIAPQIEAVEIIALAALIAVTAVFLHIRVTRRLEAMTRAMADFASGNRATRLVAAEKGDEVDATIAGLNHMMDTVLAGQRARDRAEYSLRTSEERFRHVFEETGTGLVLVDATGVITRANKAFARFTGHDDVDLVGQPLSRFELDEMSGSESLMMLDLRAGSLESAHVEKRYRHREGRVLWAELSITALGDLRDSDALIYQVQDVTARHDAQRALDEALELNQRIIDSASPGVLAFRSAGTCIFANDSAGRIFGVTSAALLGRDFRHWAPWQEARLTAASEGVLVHGGVRRISTRLSTMGRPLELDGVLSTFPRGGETHLLVLLDDATARREAESALVAATRQATIGQLSSGVAHEFNNILAILNAQLQMLQDRPEVSANPDVAPILSTLVSEVARGSALVRSLMILSRPQAPHMRALSARDAINSAMALQRKPLAAAGIAVHVEANPELMVNADPAQLQQLLLNLLLNARQAMKDRPTDARLHIRVAASDRMVHFELEDNGTGMDPATLARAEDFFFTTRGRDGTGLGLPVCQRIVHGHGGEFKLRSKKGEGSTVSFTLPVANSSHESDAVIPVGEEGSNAIEPETASPVTGMRLLIVDDEEALATGLSAFLRQRGYTVDCCTDQATARRAISHHRYAIAIVDQTIPGSSGLELSSHLLTCNPGIAIILMSGQVDQATLAESANRIGIVAVLQKPFALAELLAQVRGAIDSRAIPASTA